MNTYNRVGCEQRTAKSRVASHLYSGTWH